MSEEPKEPKSDPKGEKKGEHPALTRAIEQLDAAEAGIIPELQKQVTRLKVATNPKFTPPPLSEVELTSAWTIKIRGAGRHHNAEAKDVDRMLLGFLRNLQEAGHTIVEVAFDSGVPSCLSSPEETTPTGPREGSGS